MGEFPGIDSAGKLIISHFKVKDVIALGNASVGTDYAYDTQNKPVSTILPAPQTEAPTNTPSNSGGTTPTVTPTNTETPTQTPTNTPSGTASVTPTNTPSVTQTPTNTPSNTPSSTPPSGVYIVYNTLSNSVAMTNLTSSVVGESFTLTSGSYPVISGETKSGTHTATGNLGTWTLSFNGTGSFFFSVTKNGSVLVDNFAGTSPASPYDLSAQLRNLLITDVIKIYFSPTAIVWPTATPTPTPTTTPSVTPTTTPSVTPTNTPTKTNTPTPTLTPTKVIGNSILFTPANSDYLSVTGSTAWAVGTGDFTVEGWFYQVNNGNTNYLFSLGNTNTFAVAIGNGGNKLAGYMGGTRISNQGISTSTSVWYHWAVTRSSGTYNTYFNGTRVDTLANSTNITDSSSTFFVGYDGVNSSSFWPGNITNFRFVKGTAVYTGATYVVPTSPLTPIAGTQLLLAAKTAATFTDDTSGTNKVVVNNGTPACTYSLLTPF